MSYVETPLAGSAQEPKSSAQVEREVETTRGNLDRTVEALKRKMTPDELIGEARHALGGAGEKLLEKVIQQARENPLPLAVTGLGLAWLLTSSAKDGKVVGEGRSFAASDSSSLKDKVGDLAGRAGEVADSLQDKAQAAVQSAGDAGQDAVAKAGRYAGSMQQAIGQVIDKEPLVIGALGLFVGLAIGASLPASSLENDVVGPLHDRLMDKGRDLAKDALDQAGDAAKAAYGAAKSELSPDDGTVGTA